MSENISAPAPSAPEASPAPSSPETQSSAPASTAPAPAAKVEAAADKLDAKPLSTAPGEEKKYKVKVDGQEVTMNEQELIKHASLGKAAYKRMEEAASLRKNIEQFVDMLRKDPKKVLSDPALGLDLRKFAEEVINGEIEEMKKTPEQREKDKLAKELEELRGKVKQEEEARKQAEFQMLQEKEALKLDTDITQALDSSKLPKSPYIVKRIADYMLLALQNGIDVDVKDVLPLVRKEVSGDLRDLFSAAPEDILEEMIGKDSISKLKKRQLAQAKAKATPPTSQVKTTASSVKKEEEPKKKISMRDFMKL